MNKFTKILFFSLPLLAAIIFFIPFDPVWNYIKVFSVDKEIKSTTREYYKSLFEVGKLLFLLISLLPVIYAFFFDKISQLIDQIMKFLKYIIQFSDKHLTINRIFLASFIISIIFIISAVFLFDIGQDPAYYLNDLQNIEKYGHIMRDYDSAGKNVYLIPNLPFNILSYAFVKTFGFSVIGIRFIIVFFTFLFIYSLYLFLDKDIFKYSFILIFAIPGIYSLTSEVFLEISAISFLIFSMYFLNKYEINKSKKFEFYSLLFMVLAFSTKFQLIAYLFLVFGIMIIIETNINRRKFLILFLIKTYILIFIIIIATILPFGFNATLVYLNWYFISGAREGRAFFDTFDIKIFMVNEIVFIPLFVFVIYLYYKYFDKNEINFSFHFIALFSIVNLIYWLIFFSSVTWRNILYADVFLCIMLAMILSFKRSYARVVLSAFFLLGFISNLIFIHHGVIDEVQFMKEHYKEIVFERDNSQKIFFNKTKNIIETNANVYVPSLPYLSRVYLNNRRIILMQNFESDNKNKSYLIFDKEAYQQSEFEHIKEKERTGDYRLILNVGDYYLYEILHN